MVTWWDGGQLPWTRKVFAALSPPRQKKFAEARPRVVELSFRAWGDLDASCYRGQLDGAGAPLKRSFIQLIAVGAASRAAKMCDTPGSSTNVTRTPWAHSALAKRLVTCGSTVVSAVP
jgi:hypothetical protein